MKPKGDQELWGRTMATHNDKGSDVRGLERAINQMVSSGC